MTAPQFNPRAILALIVVGVAAFVLLLWSIGTAPMGGNGNNGGGHALSKGLTGYAGLRILLEADGHTVTTIRDPRGLDTENLLVLTPPHDAEGDEIDRIVQERRYYGPTLVVVPKWGGFPLPQGTKGAKSGWVELGDAYVPSWEGFADDLTGAIGTATRWKTPDGASGKLPVAKQVQYGSGRAMVPLVTSADGTRILAAYLWDDGDYPDLDAFSKTDSTEGGEDPDMYPVVLVFEPDLLNNYGLADKATALGALKLISAINGGREYPVAFDVTLNGLGQPRNLLTLAFTPPFLAATLCLLLAALAVGWRAFNRFGPARQRARTIAFGKTALAQNSAGLVRRTGRLRLLGAPYAALIRARLVRVLGLAAHADDRALNAALTRRDQTGYPAALAALTKAKKPHDLVRRASALKAIEKAVTHE